jgi:metal-responsive CopG/Arc/MetJ family transcriptional regulator
MRTVQMTLDDTLIDAVDRVAKEQNTNRSAFTRKALQDALVRYKLEQQEIKHRRGYEKDPVSPDEFSVWQAEQAWGDK